jgi:hypothetical protein
MSRTFINQSTQIGNSKAYDDTLSASPALEFTTGSDFTIYDDLNALRSMMNHIIGTGNWYDVPIDTLSGLSSGKLSLTGGTMTGSIDMGSNSITNVPTPTTSTDAANKDYVDGSLSASPFRYSKQYAVISGLVTAGTDLIVNLAGGTSPSLSVDASLTVPYIDNGVLVDIPDQPMIDNFVKYSDMYLNGQLLRYGTGKDFEFGSVAGSLKFEFDLIANDVICLISDQYTGLPALGGGGGEGGGGGGGGGSITSHTVSYYSTSGVETSPGVFTNGIYIGLDGNSVGYTGDVTITYNGESRTITGGASGPVDQYLSLWSSGFTTSPSIGDTVTITQ